MDLTDKNILDRTAQYLTVEYRACTEQGYAGGWQPLYECRVLQITLNAGDKPNTATIELPQLPWDRMYMPLVFGVNIRIRTSEPVKGNGDPYRNMDRCVLFQGFLTKYNSGFSGRTGASGGQEKNIIFCQDYRWLLSRTSPVFGIFSRTEDDYTTFGTDPAANRMTFLPGRRCVFNADAKPNRDPVDFQAQNWSTYPGLSAAFPIFASDCVAPQNWTARQMIQYLCLPPLNRVWPLFPLTAPSITGLTHADFDRVLSSISVDTDALPAAIGSILRHLGWSMRESYDLNGPFWVFYKPSAAAGRERSVNTPSILHALYAPAQGEVIVPAVRRGEKLLFGAEFDEDIEPVINSPIGLGAPVQIELTAPLVPAWLDTDLTVPSPAYFTEAQLQSETDPNSKDVYKYYHAQGSDFKRHVGRKWALNEAGDYSGSATFDRGMPFDFRTILNNADTSTPDGLRRFAPFRRCFLDPLTFAASVEGLDSVGVTVQFSFDGGTTWHTPQIAARVLKSECAILIEDANLSEILDPAGGTITGGSLDGVERNYWTSLCDDRANNRSFKNGQWKTCVRVTASIQLDQRLLYQAEPGAGSGSPFRHRRCYDFSDRYTKNTRTDSSVYSSTSLPAWETDEYTKLVDHLDGLRDANQDASINGRFTLDRLWLGDGAGIEDFRIGDGVERLNGRNYDLGAAINGSRLYPEIIQIVYDVQRQKQHLITRDLRLAEMHG